MHLRAILLLSSSLLLVAATTFVPYIGGLIVPHLDSESASSLVGVSRKVWSTRSIPEVAVVLLFRITRWYLPTSSQVKRLAVADEDRNPAAS